MIDTFFLILVEFLRQNYLRDKSSGTVLNLLLTVRDSNSVRSNCFYHVLNYLTGFDPMFPYWYQQEKDKIFRNRSSFIYKNQCCGSGSARIRNFCLDEVGSGSYRYLGLTYLEFCFYHWRKINEHYYQHWIGKLNKLMYDNYRYIPTVPKEVNKLFIIFCRVGFGLKTLSRWKLIKFWIHSSVPVVNE